jgi:phosphopantetheinyl transferase (holo-ACP synthase)
MRSILLVGDGFRPHVGIDAVRLDRIARIDRRTLGRHICGESELAALSAAASGDTDAGLRRTAATWAVKEAAVKARGGRTDDFSWPAIRVMHEHRPAGRLTRLVDAAMGDLAGDRPSGYCSYQWRGSDAGPGGVAAWTAADDLVLAIAIDIPAAAAGEYEGG